MANMLGKEKQGPKGWFATMHHDAKCTDGRYCHGPGCKLDTGKTARKRHRA